MYVHVDKQYSGADRMRAAAHTNSNTYGQSYQPSECRVDGQNTFLGNKIREDVNTAFLDMTIRYTPNLAQRLPASEKYKLHTGQEWCELEGQIQILKDKKKTLSQRAIYELQEKRTRLMDKALQNWQRTQPYRPDEPLKYHYGIFDRCRFMMPERDRLATNLFYEATLRSSLGLAVLRDLIALLRKPSEVQFRPGLERDKCGCVRNSSSKYDWRHIYNCFKGDQRHKCGFAELCFKCNQWIFSEKEWDLHCTAHLEDLNTFSIYFDPLVYGGVLATPGYCPYCLNDKEKPPVLRMYQFLNRGPWVKHIHRHLEDLVTPAQQGRLVLTCPHPDYRCPRSFDSVLQLRFHLEDIHGIPSVKDFWSKQTQKESDKTTKPILRRKRSQEENLYVFLNKTPRIMKDSLTCQSSSSIIGRKKKCFGLEELPLSGPKGIKDNLTPPHYCGISGEPDTESMPLFQDHRIKAFDSPTPPSSSSSTQIGSVTSGGYCTQLTPATSNDLIDPTLPRIEVINTTTVEVVDLTDSIDVPQPSTRHSESSEVTNTVDLTNSVSVPISTTSKSGAC